MFIVLIIFTAIYCIFILRILFAWDSIESSQNNSESSSKKFFSILVPIRNEAANIALTLKSILANNYDQDYYEIIVINDHSSDQSVKIVEGISVKYPNLKLINLDANLSGKKQAITYAINHATGEIILCTDGDCSVPKNWIQTFNEAYQNQNQLKLTFGGVRYNTANFFERLLQMELMGLVGIGASSIKMGYPSMINGANFSYKKKVFIEVNGYQGNEHIPSGDDEFLLRKIHKAYPNDVSFLKNKAAIVDTNPPENLKDLFNQRKRWSGKWKLHQDWFSKLIPVIIFIFNLSIISAILNSTFHFSFLILFLFLKLIVDYIYLSRMTHFNSKNLKIMPFIVLQIIYPFYVVFFGIASNYGRFTWKERNY
jgi:cellulose synthase/poly-beta-1,6-N-acetylglucosamine synthase-like glycosyltransferase